MACCYKCMRYLVFVFNFLYWLIGLSIVAIAIWLRLDNRVQEEIKVVELQVHIAVYTMMGIGVVMTVLGFLGCCGAYQESKCLLGTFFACLLIIFLAEVAGGVFIYLRPGEVRQFVGEAFQQFTVKYTMTNSSVASHLNTVQSSLKCCAGVNITAEYSVYLSNNKNQLPSSCCVSTAPVCVVSSAYDDCVSKLERTVSSNWIIFVASGAGLLFMELLGMIFAMSLCCYLRYKKRDEYEEEEPFETEHLMF